MTVYQQIANNKARTYAIILTFILLVTGFFLLIGNYIQSPTAYLIIGLSFSLFSTIGSYFYSDRIVLFTTGARLAKKEEFFDFYTVIENLSIAAGLPMPKLYVIEDPAPNAFATGRDPKHAVVCATTGLLSIMTRAELEGVIAHELSHVKNRDMLVMTVAVVLAGFLAIIADIFLRMSMFGGNNDDNGRGNALFMVVTVVGIILAPIAAQLIQLAISRKRE